MKIINKIELCEDNNNLFMDELDKISDVQVNVRKPSAPIKGICSSVEVKVFRSKKL